MMAKAISNIKKMDVPKEIQVDKDVQEIKEALSENKEAVLKGIKLLRALDDGDTLDLLYALTKQKKEAIHNFSEELNRPQYSKIFENLPEMMFLFGELDLPAIRNITGRINEGLKTAEAESQSHKTSYMDLAKALKDPDINRSITMALYFLKGMGRE
ncbi:DUF1641 domain-containing protein [Bacillus tianshenii]|nr:DUF1641 domain-containing protein [Bacillus tianshenii]